MNIPAQNKAASADNRKIDKRSPVPAYAQLADILRNAISRGEYPPGGRLPSESALAKFHGVSAMTARQAVGVLMDEGLVRRIQGRGTYVCKIGFSATNFELNALDEVFSDKENLAVRIITATVEKAAGSEREVLELETNQPVILVERIIFHQNEPFALHVSYTRFDPKSPTIESMLDTVVLTKFVFQEEYSNFKRGLLRLFPIQITEKEAELLSLKKGENAFRLEHLFYDFDNIPAAFGWFTVSHEKMPLLSKVGIWND